MTKTPVTYKETVQGILTVGEIERVVMDNLIKVQKYLFRNYHKLPINQATVKCLHKLLTAGLFDEGGNYRKHNVELGSFEPPTYFKVPQCMIDWDEDYKEREKHARTREEKIELCAWLIHRFLWVHPFFDYNGRISRLMGELFLLKNKLPVVTFQSVKRVDFVRAVKRVTDGGDLKELIELINGE